MELNLCALVFYDCLLYKGFLPDIILYNIMIMAITNRMCIKPPVPIPGTMPNKPNNHTIIAITATSQRIFFIMFNVFVSLI